MTNPPSDSIAESAHTDELGVDDNALFAHAGQSPLGQLFLRWTALLGELKELSQKRDRAQNQLDDTVMASLLSRRVDGQLSDLARLIAEMCAAPATSTREVLYKLAVWRSAREADLLSDERGRLIASAYADLSALTQSASPDDSCI